MSGRSRGLLGVFVVVAIVAVAYFSFFYSPPKEKGLEGAIGTADRYRAEQINSEDVKLAGQKAGDSAVETADLMSDEELSGLFGRLSPVERADFFQKMNIFEMALGKMDVAEKASIFERLTPAERARFFERYNITAERYSAMSAAERADILNKMTPAERADVFDRFIITAERYTAMSVAQRGEIFDRLTAAERVDFFDKLKRYTPSNKRVEDMSVAERADILEKMTPAERSELFERVNVFAPAMGAWMLPNGRECSRSSRWPSARMSSNGSTSRRSGTRRWMSPGRRISSSV